MATQRKERRSHPRVKAEIPLRISWAGRPQVTLAHTCNLSCSGLYGILPTPVDLFSRLNIVLNLPASEDGRRSAAPLEFVGVVVRSELDKEAARRKHYGTSIFFSDISEEARNLIGAYVSERTKASTMH